MYKQDLYLSKPLLNAAGSLGFAPNPHGTLDLEPFGAFVTNPISRLPRSPAEGRTCCAYPGGFLLHTGWPNPGLRAVLRLQAPRWADAPLPIIVHLLAENPPEVAEMVRALEGLENVLAIELGIPPQASREQVAALVRAARGELPVIACLPFERAVELVQVVVQDAPGVTAISLAAPRGVLPLGEVAASKNATRFPSGGFVSGRLYGPAVFPLALAAVAALAAPMAAAKAATLVAVIDNPPAKTDLKIIAGGGVYSRADVQAMLAAGAAAVQIDSALWV